jgi:hypothetical protein
MASLLGRELAALCTAVADAPAGAAPPPEVSGALAHLAQADDPAQAAIGAYLSARLSAEPGPPLTFGEPLDTLLAAVFPVDRPTSTEDLPMTTDLLSRIDQLPPDAALHALALLRAELTGDDVALRRALEDAPDDALAALAAAFPDVVPAAMDGASLAKQALALVARDASGERRALVEHALTAPASKETLTSPMEAAMEAAGLISIVVLALKTKVDVGYDKKKGFHFHVIKEASSDSLVKTVMSGLLSMFRGK